MREKSSFILGMFLLIIFYFENACANWQGPHLVVQGYWGDSSGEFGFVPGDPEDGFPRVFFVDSQSNILILDNYNKRVQIYKGGEYRSSILPKALNLNWEARVWPSGKAGIVGTRFLEAGFGKFQVYNFDGTLASEFKVENARLSGIFNDEKIVVYIKSTKQYKIYSWEGQILGTFQKKPLELGLKTNEILSDEGYQTTIKYADFTYLVKTNEPVESFVRDQAGQLYATVHNYLDKPNHVYTDRVIKYDHCGKALGHWDKPFGDLREPVN